jgi:hypothetical protein
MSLTGRLDTLPFGDLVQIIANGRKSGTLELTRDGHSLRFVFDQGRVTGALEGNLSTDDHLRFVVGRYKLLSRAETSSLEKLARRRSQTFAQAMLSMNLVDEEELLKAVVSRTREVFVEVMNWNDGRFSFRDTEPEELPALCYELRVDEMLLAAFTAN